MKKGYFCAAAQGEDFLVCIRERDGGCDAARLDVATGDMKVVELLQPLLGKAEIQCGKEYVVIYGGDRKVFVLDSDFSIADSFQVKKKLADIDRNYCVLPKAEKLVYAKNRFRKGGWYQEVSECDYDGGNKREICRIYGAERSVGKLNSVVGMIPSEDERSLFFSGLYFKTADEGEQSSHCFGRIDRGTGEATSILECKERVCASGDAAVFADGLQERGVSASGYITRVDGNGRAEKYSFREKDESQEVIVSDRGNYYLSYRTSDEEKTTDVSCYSFSKSRHEWDLKLPEYVSDLFYFEEENCLIYSYYKSMRKLRFQKEDVEK